MKLVCAWCKKIIKDGPPEPVSHGICDTCKDKVLTVLYFTEKKS